MVSRTDLTLSQKSMISGETFASCGVGSRRRSKSWVYDMDTKKSMVMMVNDRYYLSISCTYMTIHSSTPSFNYEKHIPSPNADTVSSMITIAIVMGIEDFDLHSHGLPLYRTTNAFQYVLI